ncbi:hypothetical protein [Pseudomonas sp. TNT2022 ID642]|uniref:hypothetical protein n=1 Tax=Pseudomonas sp. TNT2022 ID642 TaxID=2942632 RepID=UPI00235FCD85|nr:hypothetical protein [Pseudomonas sp. TNT2022 ID642]MDD1004363.1 hypothetical protein [Pseudomonas sp. TNT2022 ID642]
MTALQSLGLAYRKAKVDALFVPDWNQDTQSSSALMESAALDMHATPSSAMIVNTATAASVLQQKTVASVM